MKDRAIKIRCQQLHSALVRTNNRIRYLKQKLSVHLKNKDVSAQLKCEEDLFVMLKNRTTFERNVALLEGQVPHSTGGTVHKIFSLSS
jgi:hypothetical protein